MCTDARQADRQWDEIRWQADRASMIRGFGDSESCFHFSCFKEKKVGKQFKVNTENLFHFGLDIEMILSIFIGYVSGMSSPAQHPS